MNEHDLLEAKKAGALALDIVSAGFHLPIEDGKINEEQIHDQITIAIYMGMIGPLSQSVVDLAISSVQDLVDITHKK